MVDKLIADRWHVIYFAPDHNHDLVVKPSLKKFLRSHKGIPKEEKEFIALLHGCNLSTGWIMQLMNEFYGSAQLVPYEGKDVGNFRSTTLECSKPWTTLESWNKKIHNFSTKLSLMLTTGWSAYFGLIVLQGMPTLNLTVIWCLLMLPT